MIWTNAKIFARKVKVESLLRFTSLGDFVLFRLGINVSKIELNETLNIRLYVGENLPPRISRMVKWLKRSEEFSSVLICHQRGYNSKFSNDFFNRVILFRNEWHLRRILACFKKYKPLIHSFGPKSFYPNVARIYMNESKFVYDMQDVLVIYFGINVDIPWYQKEFPHERNCLALSDGLVSHGLEPIPAYKAYGIKKKNKRLFFPLYCDDDCFQPNNKQLIADDIHIVYAGEIQSSDRDKRQFGNIQFGELIEEFTKQKIHFHVYPSPATHPVFFEEYMQLALKNSFFHLHQAVAQKDIAKELAQYHFGFIPFFKSSSGQSNDKYRYSTSLKLFNFIEAGIPVIVSEDITFQSWMVLRYHAGFSVSQNDISQLRKKIEAFDYSKAARELILNRERLSLKKNIHRLAEFYLSINDLKE